MSSLHPAAETAAVENCATGAIYMESLRNAFLPTSHGHDDLESRTGCQLCLYGPVQQRMIRIIHQLGPLITRNSYSKIIRIKRRAACHGENFTRVRIHGDNRAILSFERLLGGDLNIEIN